MSAPWKYVIFVFISLVAYHLLLITPTFAQSPASASASGVPTQPLIYNLPSTVNPTSPLYTDLLVYNLFHSFSCLAMGQSVIGHPCLTYQVTRNAQGALQSVPVLSQVDTSGGALGAIASITGMLYTNPPVRTVDYLASLRPDLGVVKNANAQVGGSGAKVLNPVLQLWQTSRNISYVILTIIFVIIGLMVMFRSKINPQTVISAQAAIPGLVVGLILITFSYFLAGLVSDVAFIGTNVVGYYFVSAQGKVNDPAFGQQLNLSATLSNESVVSIFSKFAGEVITDGTIHETINTFMNNLTPSIHTWVTLFAGLIAYQFGAQFGSALGGAVGGPVCAATGVGALIAPLCGTIGSLAGGAVVGGSIAAIAMADPGWTFAGVIYLLTIIIIIYTLLKLLLKLINSYLTIIFLTIIAPFQFLIAALPGRQGIAGQWIANMLSNLLAFPAVLAVFYFVAFLLGQSFGPLKVSSDLNSTPNTVYAAGTSIRRVVGKDTFPLFGGLDIDFLTALAAFGALLVTPAIPDIIARSIGSLSQTGQMLGQEISSGVSGGQRYAGRLGGAPGQLGQSLSESGRQLGPKYSTMVVGGKPVTVKEPGFLGLIKGKGPEELTKAVKDAK